jgi:hypothetical protein
MTFLLIFVQIKKIFMDTILQKIHYYWAYVALLVLVIAVVNAIIGMASKKEFTLKDRKIALFGLIGTHVQLLVGLILYFVSPYGFSKISTLGMGEVMKDSFSRLTVVEHPLINLIAIALITIGWSKHKKLTTSESKFKTFSIFYGLGLVLILSRIPWSLWF